MKMILISWITKEENAGMHFCHNPISLRKFSATKEIPDLSCEITAKTGGAFFSYPVLSTHCDDR